MSTTDVSALSLNDVSKTFGTNLAVNHVSLRIKKGEIFGFLGPNGAGKSTTIRMILNILKPDSGSISIFGLSHNKVPASHRMIGFLSGEMALDTDLTGKQYINFVSRMHGGGHSAEIARLCQELDASLDVPIGNYSRGNRQKIGLIAALLNKPKLLILDEPTSGFDPLVQETFARLLRQYVSEGGTVLMSSHVLGEVQHLCDRVSFIRGGKIIATESVAKLLESKAKRLELSATQETITKILKSYAAINDLELLESKPDSLRFSYSGNMPTLLKYLADKPLIDVTIREPELEEIFGQYYEQSQTPESGEDRTHAGDQHA